MTHRTKSEFVDLIKRIAPRFLAESDLHIYSGVQHDADEREGSYTLVIFTRRGSAYPIAFGIAKRNPECDRWDPQIGLALAFARALRAWKRIPDPAGRISKIRRKLVEDNGTVSLAIDSAGSK